MLNLIGVIIAIPLCSHVGLIQHDRLHKTFLFKHLRRWIGFLNWSYFVQKGSSPSYFIFFIFNSDPLVDQEGDKWQNQTYCSKANESIDKD